MWNSICLDDDDDDDDLSIHARHRILHLKAELESKKAEFLDMKAQKETFEARVGTLTETVRIQHHEAALSREERNELDRQLNRRNAEVAAAERVIFNLRRELDNYPGYRRSYGL